MVLRVVKVLFGFLIIKSSVSEYFNFLSQEKPGTTGVLLVVIILSLLGMLLIFIGVKNKKITDVFKRNR